MAAGTRGGELFTPQLRLAAAANAVAAVLENVIGVQGEPLDTQHPRTNTIRTWQWWVGFYDRAPPLVGGSGATEHPEKW